MTNRFSGNVLQKHLPEKAIPYCLDLMTRYPFRLEVKKPRQTKLGDFCAHRGRTSVITINSDLNPYLFLTTFIHEFSHHAVHLVYGNKPEAHGKEWKLAFKTFMGPLMELQIFPEDLHHSLTRHLKNPGASSYSDSHLTLMFRRYDPDFHNQVTLRQIQTGQSFKLGKKIFRKGQLRRTRILCIEIKTGIQYLVPKDSEVELINPLP